MQIRETFRRAFETARVALNSRCHEDAHFHIRGDVFITLRDGATGKVQDYREIRNLVVRDASILIARLLKDNSESPYGVFCLAVGTGDTGWDPMNPPAPTDTQRALYSELARKAFSATTFIDSGGSPTAVPTNVVDYSATFAEGEANGPLCEMGLLGGNIVISPPNPVSPPNGPYNVPPVNLTEYETEINYTTFACVNKPPTSTMTVVWRLTT